MIANTDMTSTITSCELRFCALPPCQIQWQILANINSNIACIHILVHGVKILNAKLIFLTTQLLCTRGKKKYTYTARQCRWERSQSLTLRPGSGQVSHHWSLFLHPTSSSKRSNVRRTE